MKRYGIILMVTVLAMCSLLAAAAYNSATVANAATLAVVNTDSALLTLRPGGVPGNGDANAYIDDNGELVFDFTKGLDEYGAMGFQGNSVYKWERLFEIHNKSNEAVDVSITCNLPYVSIGCETDDVVTGQKNEWWHWLPGGETHFQPGGGIVTLGPDTTVPILVTFTVPSGAAHVVSNGTITVSAVNP